MIEVDVTNTDQSYWERILAEHGLSTKKEEPEIIEITPEQFLELRNTELLPEEDYQKQDDPVINYHPITRDTATLNADHSGLMLTNDELRTKVDGDETFFTGHRIIKERRGNRICPDWASDNSKIQKLLLNAFPQLTIDKKQRAAAGRWARVIQLYYRQQLTHGQICTEMKISLPAVFSLIRAIDRAVSGKTWHGDIRQEVVLSFEEKDEIFLRYSRGDVTQEQLAQEYGVSQPSVSNIIRRFSSRRAI